jgi:hypothetical protein
MSASAVAMMIVAIVVVFGGMVVSAITLMTHPDEPED